MAGIPLTAGFIAKFYVMAAGVKSSLWTLVIILIATGTIGLYYYFRIIASMCLTSDRSQVDYAPVAPGIAAGLTLVVLTLVVFVLGVYPASFVSIVQRSLSL